MVSKRRAAGRLRREVIVGPIARLHRRLDEVVHSRRMHGVAPRRGQLGAVQCDAAQLVSDGKGLDYGDSVNCALKPRHNESVTWPFSEATCQIIGCVYF